MAETIYATFQDAGDAVKAVGALLDHGLQNESISMVSKRPAGAVGQPPERAVSVVASQRSQTHTTVTL